MISNFREYFDRKAVAVAGCWAYGAAGALLGWLMGLEAGSAAWFAVLLGWAALPFAIVGIYLAMFGHDTGDWKGGHYDY